jgi:peptidoglycan/LPS O-acetylase OafA/YrhL
VIAVLASHTLASAHGGFLGVDVFFVLSGYLITAQLIREYEATGRIHFGAFYRRRVARLAPAYLLMLALTIPLMIGPLRDAAALPWPVAVASTAVYLGNWAQAADTANLGPLLHTWSLSIEEQFYLAWPLAFLLLTGRPRALVRVVGAAVVVIMAGRTAGWLLFPGLWPYFATPTHSDGLLLGALVAVLMAWRSQPAGREPADGRRAAHRAGGALPSGLSGLASDRFSELIAWPAAGIVGAEMLVLDIGSPATYYAGLTVSALASAVLVRHLVITRTGPMARLLSLRPLVAIGRISYGLYLYHMPIFMLVTREHLGMVPTLLLQAGGTSAAAVVSWFAVEQPVQRWVARRWPPGSERRPSAGLPSPRRAGHRAVPLQQAARVTPWSRR